MQRATLMTRPVECRQSSNGLHAFPAAVPAAAGSESEGKFIYRSSTSKASAKAAQPSLPVVPRLNVAGLSVHIVKAAV